MRRLAGALVVSAAATAQLNLAHAQSAAQILSAGCADDARKFCSDVQPGGGRIIACLKQNKDSLSDQCKQAAAQASRMTSGGVLSASPAVPTGSTALSGNAADALTAAPSATSPPAAASTASPAKPARTSTPSVSGKPATAGADGSYLVMKKVQITGPGPDAAHPTVPAFDLMIPSSWKIQGAVQFGGSPSGCYADIFATSLRATNADESIVFAAGPDYSWQYADDPSVLKSLNDPNRRALGAGGKPCPVAKPMKAEDYIRQNILKIYPSGTTVVSVAPFPELNEIVRKRQGLPPGNGNTGATRTEAVRVRLAYQKDGKDIEEWVAVAVVVNIYPAGRGSFYDSHATSLVAFSAPKGKLDANDKLFQVIVSSIQPEPQWVSYSGGVLTKLYQMQAQKVANINQQWSQFYTQAAQTINGETANAMRGANASFFHEDQNIRGVQTFRDPATGKTQELSNLYNHAWQNGSNDYIMSNDPNFNPNEHVSGNWSELQAVNP
jgi:Cysteine rich repeat